MKKNWFLRILWVVSGVLLVAAGIFSFLYPVNTLWFLAFLMGWVMLVSGIMDVVTYIGVGGALPGSGWILADGILTIILSFFVLGNQAFTAVSLPFIFGIWIIFSGITRLVNAMEFQRVGAQGWGWMIVHGILDILFGILCFLEPLAGSIAIGILVGVSFLLQAAFTFFMLWEMIRAKRI